MLKIISSKNESELHTLAKKEKNRAKIETPFLDCTIFEAESLSENLSIFGSVEAYMIRIEREAELEKINKGLLKIVSDSPHFFVIIGSGSEFEKKITSEGEKVLKIEEKKVFDFPADLVAALQKHDKKNSWDLLLRELNNKDAEPVHGSCVFAYKSLLTYLNNIKKNSPHSGVKDFSWKQAGANAKLGQRERVEVVNKYFELILAYHKARNGELDLKTQLERWILMA